MDPARDARQGAAARAKGTFALGAGAIALFVASAAAVIWAIGDGDAPRPTGGVGSALAEAAAPPPVAPLPAAVPPAPPAASPPASPPPATSPRADEPAIALAPPEDVDPTWRDVPVVFGQRDELGAVGPYVIGSLRNARLAMAHCLAAPVPARDAAAPEEPPILLLYLASREGAVDVVDARVDDLGSASAEVVECARVVLHGHEIRAPNAQPGQRYRLKYALSLH